MRSNVCIVAGLLFLAPGCDGPEDESAWVHEEEPATFREVHPCAEHNAKLPQTQAGLLALFNKVALITDDLVIKDPCRTSMDPAIWLQKKCPLNTQGVWTFWSLMSQMAGTNNTSGFIMRMLESLEEGPSVNGVPLSLRSKVRSDLIDPWRSASGCAKGLKWNTDQCQLNPKAAPFYLTAIVNRMDLRPDANGNIVPGGYLQPADSKDTAGEGRFVFNFMKPNLIDPMEGGIILEYALPTANFNRVQWADSWLALNNHLTITPAYLSALQTITDRFTRKGAFPGRPNGGSAINAVRTNELAFDPRPINQRQWSLRAFKLDCVNCLPDGKLLLPQPVEQTPMDSKKNDEVQLLPFLDANAVAIRGGKHVVPEIVNGLPFIGGESRSHRFFDNPFIWAGDLMMEDKFVDDLNAADTRRKFAMATCNGCHYKETENKTNMHVRLPGAGMSVQVSDFLSKTPITLDSVFDKNDVPVQFNEPKRRLCELHQTRSGAAAPLTNFFGGGH